MRIVREWRPRSAVNWREPPMAGALVGSAMVGGRWVRGGRLAAGGFAAHAAGMVTRFCRGRIGGIGHGAAIYSRPTPTRLRRKMLA